MTGLFAGLARRGAGLAPEPGAALIALRPRARFEPMPGLPEAEGGGAVALADAPPPSAPADRTPGRIGPDVQPAPPSISPSAAEAPYLPAASRPPSPTPLPAEPPAAPASPAELAPIAAETVREPAPIPSPAVAQAEPLPVPEPPATREPLDRQISIEISSEPPAGEAPVPVAAALPPAPAAPPPPGATLPVEIAEPRPELLPPQVTIAIERIDIALAPPPPPRVAAPPAVARSSGFAAYARARRGSPR